MDSLRRLSAIASAFGSEPVARGHNSYGAMTLIGKVLLQAGALAHTLNCAPEMQLAEVKVATASAAAAAAALCARFAPGAVAGTQRAFERGGLEGQLLVQHLRSAFFTAGSTTKPDFVCDPHTDPTMLEVIFFFQQLADGSYAPMPSSEGFFVVPGAGLCFALGASPRGCAILQQASSTHFTVSAAGIRSPSNGASAESRAELAAHAAGAASMRIGVCFVAREALLRMPLAVAAKRAAHARETWGYAAPPASCAEEGDARAAKKARC
jgi:hypothetical protein